MPLHAEVWLPLTPLHLCSALCLCRVSPIPPYVVLISTQRTSVKTTNYVDTRAEFLQKPHIQGLYADPCVLRLDTITSSSAFLNPVRYSEHLANKMALWLNACGPGVSLACHEIYLLVLRSCFACKMLSGLSFYIPFEQERGFLVVSRCDTANLYFKTWMDSPVYKIINSFCSLILLILVWKQAKYHQVMKYHEGRFATDQTFRRPQTIHGQLEKRICVFIHVCLFPLLRCWLYICWSSVLPHTEAL